jgi:hypothetical protein
MQPQAALDSLHRKEWSPMGKRIAAARAAEAKARSIEAGGAMR